MLTKITIQDLYNLPTVFVPGAEAIKELQDSLHWSVSEFVDDGRWKFEILTDSTTMPPEAWHRKDLIEGAGVEVEWFIAHEVETQPVKVPEIVITKEDEQMILKVLLVIAGIVVFIWLLPFVLLLAVFAMGCASGDPALIAKVKNQKGEDVCLVCYRWY